MLGAVGLLGFFIAMVLSWVRWPVPSIHDEFSHLLLADTLRHGRLSNPTPEAWQAFQSFHTILVPTYSSKYPLGPGALLALGWVLFGTPTAGLWLGAGFCSAAITWTLAAVVPRRWALIGGMLIALHPAMHTEWSRSYMNGWLTATAASIIVGSVVRLRKRNSIFASIILGFGIGLMSLCRPFEGLIFTALCLGSLVWHWGIEGQITARRLMTASLGGLPCITLAIIVIAAHNFATTGSWLCMPYQLHEAQYAVAPLFITQATQAPEMATTGENSMPALFEKINSWSVGEYSRYTGVAGFLRGVFQRLAMIRDFWGWWLAIVPCFAIVLWRVSSLVRWSVLGVISLVTATSITHWSAPHYLAPIVPWLAILATLALRRVACLAKIRPRFIVATVAAYSLLSIVWVMTESHAAESQEWSMRRFKIEAQLNGIGGKHLVFVHYRENHNVHQEWVYNLANIAESQIIWARSCRDDWRQMVIDKYGSSRSIWETDADSPSTLIRSACKE